MRHPALVLLCCLMTPLVAESRPAQADFSQCHWQPPAFEPVAEQAPPRIQADQMRGKPGETTQLQGAVVITGQGMRLRSEEALFDQANYQARLPQPLLLQSALLGLRAQTGRLNWKSRQARFEQAEYWLQTGRGRGQASQVQLQGQKQARLEQFSFTTCDPEQPQWQLQARSVRLDLENKVGYARHARLKLLGVPVFYSPWLRFPLSGQRQSGLLAPTFQYNEDTGFDYRQPYYWNIAPNQDMTFNPRFTARRGWLLGVEHRYWLGRHKGLWQAEYLPDDRVDGQSRHMFNLEHRGRLGRHWTVSSRLFDVSDPDYFRDFGNTPARTVLSYQRSHLTLSGRWRHGELRLLADRYTILDSSIRENNLPWRRLPSLQGRWQGHLGPWVIGMDGEWVQFDHDSLSGGQRRDANLWLGWEHWNPGRFLRARAAWRQTDYALDDGRSLSRGLPLLSLDAGLVFENPTGHWRKTLEPRLFALYVPYREQQSLPLFDTTEPSFSFQQLFRDNRFSGADRQSDAQQLTLAVSHRWLNPASGREKLALHVGQTYYLRAPRVGLRAEKPATDQSPLAAQLDYRSESGWQFSAGLVASSEDGTREKSSFRVSRRFDGDRFLQLGYRQQQNRLEQLDLFGRWPLGQRWHVLGRLNGSLQNRRNLDSLLGLEYESCCLQGRLVVRRYALDNSDNGRQRTGIYLEFNLKGMGSLGRSARELLQRSLFDRI